MFKIAVCDDEGHFRSRIKEILEEYAMYKGVRYEIDTFSSGQEFVRLGIEMVKYKITFLDIESRLHMLEFHIMEEKLMKYTLCETLNKIEGELAGNGFVRIHQSYLINMRYIKSVRKYSVLLYNGDRFEVLRTRYRQVEEMLIAYQGRV